MTPFSSFQRAHLGFGCGEGGGGVGSHPGRVSREPAHPQLSESKSAELFKAWKRHADPLWGSLPRKSPDVPPRMLTLARLSQRFHAIPIQILAVVCACSASKCYPQIGSRLPRRYLHTRIRSGIIYNYSHQPKVGATQGPAG